MVAGLDDFASHIRSKNASAFTATFDIMFPDVAAYRHVVDSGAVNPESVGALYNLPPEKVRIFNFEPALAIKVTIPRLVASGDPGDRDINGGQLFVPLLEIRVPD